MDEINGVWRALDWEKMCVYGKDKMLMRKCVDVVRVEGGNVFCKDKRDFAWPGCDVSEDVFCDGW